MKITKKLFLFAGLPVLGLGLLGAGTASAHGMFGFGGFLNADQKAQIQTQMFQKQADLLGVNVDDVKNAWAQGKSIKDLASEKGITEAQMQEKMKTQRESEFKQYLQDLVTKGVITQSQADQRLQFLQKNINDNQGRMGRHRGMGMMGF